MIGTHALSGPDFAALANGLGDPGAITALRRGQYSKRLVQLRLLLDAAGEAGLSAALEPGTALLAAAQRADPASVCDLLLHPPTGEWLAHCLRRLCGRAGHEGSAPLADDLGHLGAIAAAAALRAGADFTITLPSRAGTVMLPSLGLVRLAGLEPGAEVTVTGRGDGQAVVEGGGISVTVPAGPAAPAAGWTPVRRLEPASADGHPAVYLDDLDPFRDCHGSATAGPADSRSAERWRALLAGAWSLLARTHPGYAAGIGAGLTSIVPLTKRPGRGLTATSPDSFGSCMMSEPADAVAMAVGLVHEFQHAKLGALMDLVPLHRADGAARYYAPWRDDPRPLGGLLHGTYAFLAVADFWRAQRELEPHRAAQFAHFEFARRREQVADAVTTLESSGQLTETGARLVAAIGARLRDWARELPPAAEAAAQSALADHRARWRLRHLRPAAGRVARLAAAWQAGEPCPPDEGPAPAICPAEGPGSDGGRLDLLSLRLREPERLARLAAQPAELAALIPAASDADLAYARGDLDDAAAGYERALASEPGSVAAWAGLAVIRGQRPGRGADPLADEPELIMALYLAVRARAGGPARPGELASWVTGTAARCRTGAVSGH